MAEKRRKRKRKGKSSGPAASGAGGGGVRTGGGVLQSIRAGIRRAAGAEESKDKPSKLSNAIWTAILIAAVCFLIYRWYLA